jgi:hypothetical protein
MSSRTAAFLFLACTLGVSTAAGAGCSGDDTSTAAATDGGTDVASEARPAPPEDDDAATPKTCREQCADAHPAGVAKDKAIDACWQAHCASPCIDGERAPIDVDAGADASADAGADAGACMSPVVTASPSCDACTTAFCCASWDACFQDAECSALEDCYQQCVE